MWALGTVQLTVSWYLFDLLEFHSIHEHLGIQWRPKVTARQMFLGDVFLPFFTKIMSCNFHLPQLLWTPISSLLCGLECASKQKAKTPASLTSSAALLSGITVLPIVQCLRIIVSYILSSFLIVYCVTTVNLVYAMSSCQKEMSHLTFDYWSFLCSNLVFIIVI